MNESDFATSYLGKSPPEAKEKMMALYSAMPPERLAEHVSNMRDLAIKSGQDNEREELVCRLLANGMPVEEIAVVLCLRTEVVNMIEHNNAATKIPEYAKKLKERRKRREQKSE